MEEFINRISGKTQSVPETTTSANIAYLPSGFRKVTKALKTLRKKKNDWKVRTIESDDHFDVVFEDSLCVKVSKDHWKDFMTRLCPSGDFKIPDTTLDLGLMNERRLNEANKTHNEEIIKQVRGALLELFVEPPLATIDEHVELWKKTFKTVHYLPQKGSVLQYPNFESELKSFLKSLTPLDRGTLEMVLSSIEDRRSLVLLDEFKGYQRLLGARILSVYGGNKVEYRGSVSMAFVPSESIVIYKSPEAVEQLEDEQNVKAHNNTIYPKGKFFDDIVFQETADILKEVEN